MRIPAERKVQACEMLAMLLCGRDFTEFLTGRHVHSRDRKSEDSTGFLSIKEKPEGHSVIYIMLSNKRSGGEARGETSGLLL